ncbi:disulfide bond formation protein B [Pigmentiphaga aceris]|uniref:Disulfide bond formation protein B n=2 Tax=Pigmentiphaga aceris TaxID=1940612 RepID=A0A5C0B6T8_9BURK|nr:disulfide bond formation protein B [Pigmentiphaga aceris]
MSQSLPRQPATPSPSLPANPWWSFLLFSWLIALVSTLGALFLSELMDFTPCVLCWYQRIAMFPLVLILGIGTYTDDVRCIRYAQPLAVIGWLLAVYHCLLYIGLIPTGLQPCGAAGSCAKVDLQLAGFITIPLLSLVAFSLIVLLLWAAKRKASS